MSRAGTAGARNRRAPVRHYSHGGEEPGHGDVEVAQVEEVAVSVVRFSSSRPPPYPPLYEA